MVDRQSNHSSQHAPAAPTAMAGLIGGFVLSQAIYAAAKLAIADRLQDGPRTPEDLAQEASCDAGALYRLACPTP